MLSIRRKRQQDSRQQVYVYPPRRRPGSSRKALKEIAALTEAFKGELGEAFDRCDLVKAYRMELTASEIKLTLSVVNCTPLVLSGTLLDSRDFSFASPCCGAAFHYPGDQTRICSTCDKPIPKHLGDWLLIPTGVAQVRLDSLELRIPDLLETDGVDPLTSLLVAQECIALALPVLTLQDKILRVIQLEKL